MGAQVRVNEPLNPGVLYEQLVHPAMGPDFTAKLLDFPMHAGDDAAKAVCPDVRLGQIKDFRIRPEIHKGLQHVVSPVLLVLDQGI